MFEGTKTRTIDVGGFQNLERIISHVLKEERYRSLYSVIKVDDKTLKLHFSEHDFRFNQKRKVVQFSKNNYKKEEEVEAKIKEEKNKKSTFYEPLWTDIQVVELPRVWLAFCKR